MSEYNKMISYTLSRGPLVGDYKAKVGLALKIKAHADVEAYMQQLSNNQTVGVEAFGEGWVLQAPPNAPFEVYQFDTPAEINAAKQYTIDQVAQGLIVVPERGGRGVQARLQAVMPNEDGAPVRANAGQGGWGNEIINLSFLKLRGISGEEGITIGFYGAYSADYINKLKTTLPAVTKQFLHDFIVPMTINLEIVSKPYGF